MRVNHNARVAKLELGVVKKVCEAFDTPRALTVALLIQNQEWEQLVNLSINANHYSNHSSFSDDYLVTSMLQKNPRLPLEVDKKAVAIRKFYASEEACKETNKRIGEYYEDPLMVDPELRSVLLSTQAEIQNILGPFPTRQDLAYAEDNMRFGPGATTSLSGVVTQGMKYSPRPLEVTPRLLPFRTFCFPDLWKQHVVDINVVESSKLTTVPKNAKTDRVICIEPDLNIFVQLGCGALLKQKLLRSGLDLTSQETNREFAQRAHRDRLATLDLSAASDTVSREAVWMLLPHAWAELLHFSRVDKTRVEGEELTLHKWSSMGNGYTFELETLIFYAVSRVVCRHLGLGVGNITVYGDDIILPLEALTLVVKALNFLGFSVNHEKTFGEGRFHESCGADFFDGHNVRPFFLRTEHHDFETICFIVANGLRRWASRRNGGDSCDSRLLPAWLHCFTAVEPHLRFKIPEGFGDVGFVSDFDRAQPKIRHTARRLGWAGYHFQYRSCRARERTISIAGAYFSALNGKKGSDFRQGVEALRGRFEPATTKKGYVLHWPNLGPWL